MPLRSNCVRGFDLTLLESASEFLGPYEFKVGESVGWGETVMYARKHGQVSRQDLFAASCIFKTVCHNQKVISNKVNPVGS